MARSMGPRFKLSTHLGVNVFNHQNALKIGIIKHSLSEYGEQLLQKQTLKAYYGVLEKQFKKYVIKAIKANDKTETVLVQRLESRLDNIVYRLGFGSTLIQARQIVNHGHILVNGHKVNFNTNDLNVNYLEKDLASYSGWLKTLPHIEDVPIDVKFSKVIEF